MPHYEPGELFREIEARCGEFDRFARWRGSRPWRWLPARAQRRLYMVLG